VILCILLVMPYLWKLIVLLFLGSTWFSFSNLDDKETPVIIDFWYGSHQRAGHLGQPQRWVNVLGNISPVDQVEKVFYLVNGQAPNDLTLGSDLHRLAAAGDFNIEIRWNDLQIGENIVTIEVLDKHQRKTSKSMLLDVEKGQRWPLPYQVDFSKITNIQTVVQVVDGLWEKVPEGVRTKDPYYDRVLTMGDSNWQNYQALIKLTIHDWTPSEPGPPTYNVSHFGAAMRWRGHHSDGRQPSRKWYPLGAQGEFLLKENTDSCQWRILYDGNGSKKPKYADQINDLKKGQPLFIRTQIKTLPDGRSQYSFKQWMEGNDEPKTWNVEGLEMDDYASGALCLVPHNSDVTIHQVEITPIP
jgi:hypothetical protein